MISPFSGRRPGAAALLAVGAVLAGCSSGPKDTSACPRAEIPQDLSRLVQFREGPGQDPSDILFTARMVDARTQCKFDDAGISVEISLAIRAERGRAGAKLPGAALGYFIAVTEGDEIVQKQNFETRILFDEKGQALETHTFDQRLPNKAKNVQNLLAQQKGRSMVFGFQLTPDQINYNEKTRRN